MIVQIEPMTEVDWPGVADIHREGIATGHATFTAEPAASYADFCADKYKVGNLVARDAHDGAVLGWTTLARVSARPVYAGVAEVGVYVGVKARGHGAGTALLRELILRAEGAGIWTLQASIFEENTASLSLHRRLGFREVGRRERIGKMPAIGPFAGKWRDTLLLERRSGVVGTT
jgi:L-amino acid N-acyltransferase YncA